MSRGVEKDTHRLISPLGFLNETSHSLGIQKSGKNKDRKEKKKDKSKQSKHHTRRSNETIPMLKLNTETDQTQELLDEIKRLRLLLAEKDSVILELQRALESQKREQCDSLASSPSMPAGLDKLSSGGGAKTVRAPSPLRNESRRDKPHLRRTVSDNYLKRMITSKEAISPKGSSGSSSGNTSSPASVSSVTSGLPSPHSSSASSASASIVISAPQQIPSSGSVQDLASSPPRSPSSSRERMGSFINNIFSTSRAGSPSRGIARETSGRESTFRAPGTLMSLFGDKDQEEGHTLRKFSAGSSTAVFGQPVDVVLKGGIPKFFCAMIAHLETNGPSSADTFATQTNPLRIQSFKAAINSGQDVDFQTRCSLSETAALLKVFLRDMPAPLLSSDSQAALIRAAEIEDEGFRQSAFHVVMNCDVDQSSRVLLQRMLSAFYQIHASSQHHCSASALAVYFAPSAMGYTDGDLSPQQVAGVQAFAKLIHSSGQMHTLAQTLHFSFVEGKPVVKSATLRRCIELLLDPSYHDYQLTCSLLSCVHYFMSPSDFVSELFNCYNMFVTQARPKPWQQRARVVDRLVEALKIWARDCAPSPQTRAEMCKWLTLFNQASIHVLPDDISALFEPPKQLPRTFDLSPMESQTLRLLLADSSADTIAKQLTLLEVELFRAIPSYEFLSKQLSNAALSPRFHASVNQFNTLGLWAATEVLASSTTADRTSALAKLIDIAYICRRLSNFSTAMAIFSGINMSCVCRLKNMWEKLPKQQAKRYLKLETLLAMDNNYQALRQEQRKAHLPTIPHVALYTKMIATIEEASDSRLENGLINVEKLRSLWKIAAEIQRFQSAEYMFEVQPALRASLQSLRTWNEEQLLAASITIQPSRLVHPTL